MSKKRNKQNKISPPVSFGKNPTFIADSQSEKRPWFSHRFICQAAYCIKKCSIEQFKQVADTLRILSDLEWKTIQSSPRETHGYEMIPVKQIKSGIPSHFKNLEKIMVFRFGKGRIAGTREGNNFYILFIDHNFTLYDHGS